MSTSITLPNPRDPKTEPPASDDWVEKSDEQAHRVLDVYRRFEPEYLSWFGDAESATHVFQLPEDVTQQKITAFRDVVADMEIRLAEEEDPNLATDLEILLRRSRQKMDVLEMEQDLLTGYRDVPRAIYEGLRSLLDDRSEPVLRRAALARLRRYVGGEEGFSPVTEQLREHLRPRLGDARLVPLYRRAVERDLRTIGTYTEAIGRLFAVYEIEGYEKDLATLGSQLARHEQFVRDEVLPRTRDDFRLPSELYRSRLRDLGVDMDLDELASRAKVELKKTQWEIEGLIRRLVGKKLPGFSEYRAVLRGVTKERIAQGRLPAHYEKRFRKMLELLERHDVVSLPEALDVRLVPPTRADSAAFPHMYVRAPRYLASGESGAVEVVLPGPGPGEPAYDVAAEAASRNVALHEAAHALQMAAWVRCRLPLARTLFVSSSHLEGWATYLESEVRPYLSPVDQLVSLQRHLCRAAKAFLEPGLHEGTVSPEEAARVLREDAALSPVTVRAELERYTFLCPGQALTYLAGYLREIELRAEAELTTRRSAFRVREYHDRRLEQGFLPFSQSSLQPVLG